MSSVQAGLTRLLRSSVVAFGIAGCGSSPSPCTDTPCIVAEVLAAPDERAVHEALEAAIDPQTFVAVAGDLLNKDPELGATLCGRLPHGLTKERCQSIRTRPHLWSPIPADDGSVVRAGSGPAYSSLRNSDVPVSRWQTDEQSPEGCRAELDPNACLWGRAKESSREGDGAASGRWCAALRRHSSMRADCFFEVAEDLVEHSGLAHLADALELCGGAGAYRALCAQAVLSEVAQRAPPSTVGDVVVWAPQLMAMRAVRSWINDPVMQQRMDDRYLALTVHSSVSRAVAPSGDIMDALPAAALPHLRAAISHRIVTAASPALRLREAVDLVNSALNDRVFSSAVLSPRTELVLDLWPVDREGESHLRAISYLGASRRTVANDAVTDTTICILEAAARATPPLSDLIEEAKTHHDERVRWTSARLVEQLEAHRLGTESAQWAPAPDGQTPSL